MGSVWIKVLIAYLCSYSFIRFAFHFLSKAGVSFYIYDFLFLIGIWLIVIRGILSREKKFRRWLYNGAIFFILYYLSFFMYHLYLKVPAFYLLKDFVLVSYFAILAIYLNIPAVKSHFK